MITRFAPSPTGPLHLGHAFSALTAYDLSSASNGNFLLRIEDIDKSRCRDHWEAQIYDDLAWLGVHWETPVMHQSDRLHAYRKALHFLWNEGLIYPCSCNRKDILNALSAPQEGVDIQYGPDGPVYPGTCKPKNHSTSMPYDQVLRLDAEKAFKRLGGVLAFTEKTRVNSNIEILPEVFIAEIGDIVLARRDMGTSYHLSVVLDDATQSITDVVRGEDLFEATKIHVVLQKLLGLPTPAYHHHKLIRDENGKRLAKRDDARAISKYREEGYTPSDIRKLLNLPAA